MHVLDHGRGVVAISRLGAGGTGVVVVEAKTVGPTIVHMKPIVSDNRHYGWWCRWNRDSWGHRWGCCNGGGFGNFADGCIGAMKSCLADGSFFVYIGEMHVELNECLVGSRMDMPGVTCHGEYTSSFKHGESEVDDGGAGQRVIASHRDALHFTELFPQDFNRVFWGPNGGNASMIAFKFGTCDGSIGGT